MNNEMIALEKEIEGLDDIKEWSDKIIKMKELKEKITLQKSKINTLLETINSGEVKKTKKTKKDKESKVNLDDLLKEVNLYEENDPRFSLLPYTGKRDLFGNFENEGCESYFWTASEEGEGGGQMLAGDKNYARYRKFDEEEYLQKGKIIKKSGLSVRCIKNS